MLTGLTDVPLRLGVAPPSTREYKVCTNSRSASCLVSAVNWFDSTFKEFE